MRFVWVFLIFAGLAAPLAAQQQLGAYYAEIGYEDMRNSRGVRLGDFGSVLQQDRANVHRFGIWHDGDQADPYFANRNLRASIPALYRNGPREALIEQIVMQGNPLRIVVIMCGYGGSLNYLVVGFADGDWHPGCS
ncbi:hypothetical protein [Pseudoruegeria sp. HB172150]|uniref:hypothetical protein n=1 Tax=Pseudoruegeria sp. HB172150 TaxID=2721164 RepID=UPI001552CCA7|nr:hypothetical protein [Pseudoruegeria sp. HB172150]